MCARFIDPYGDTVFNQVQLPVLIDELAGMVARSADAGLRERLDAVIRFLRTSREVHTYVRFIGD